MNLSSLRIGAASLALAAAAVGVFMTSSGQPLVRADDDISDYDGTSCAADQFYDASSGSCSSDAVSNNPNGVLPSDVPGISDPGKRCMESQDYNVSDQGCVPDVVTNDPADVVKPEGEDPTEFAVPTVGAIYGCTSDGKSGSGGDPFKLCA